VLKPLDIKPKKVTLLNDNRSLDFSVQLLPRYWREKPYLRVRKIPVDEFTGTVMVIKIEFDSAIND
jgi:alpha-L-fucosidase